MNRAERISIVMCTYNGEKFLREQLDSIIQQTYPIYELIIQDDHSADGTTDIVKEYQNQYPYIQLYINENNIGFKENFGTAAAKATGDYVAFSDQDDIWANDHIETLINCIGNKILACGDSLLINAEGHSLGYTLSEEKKMNYIPSGDIDKAYSIFYSANIYQGANMLMKKSFLKKLLPIPEGVPFHDTWAAGLACFCGGISYVNKIITYYRQHGSNVTSHKKKGILLELKMRHHVDYYKDRIFICDAIHKRIPELSNKGIQFFQTWECYQKRSSIWYFHLYCYWVRFSHYKFIYSSPNYQYFLLRSIHYLCTPTFPL